MFFSSYSFCVQEQSGSYLSQDSTLKTGRYTIRTPGGCFRGLCVLSILNQEIFTGIPDPAATFKSSGSGSFYLCKFGNCKNDF